MAQAQTKAATKRNTKATAAKAPAKPQTPAQIARKAAAEVPVGKDAVKYRMPEAGLPNVRAGTQRATMQQAIIALSGKGRDAFTKGQLAAAIAALMPRSTDGSIHNNNVGFANWCTKGDKNTRAWLEQA